MSRFKGKTSGKRDISGPRKAKTCTALEARLAKGYALHGRLTAAYREAGYAVNPKNPENDYDNARQIIGRPHVFAEYEKWKAEFSKRMDISDNRILAEMAAVGFINAAHVVDQNGLVMNLQDMPEHVSRAIKKMKVRRRVITTRTQAPDEDVTEDEAIAEDIIEIEFHDKLKALSWIAEINGMKPEEAPPEINVNVKIDGKMIANKEREPESER